MNKYLSFIALLLFIPSCTVGIDDDVTVTKNRSGSLKIRVIDSDGNPLQNSGVNIYESGYLLQQGVSDASGYYDAEKLLEGQYNYTISAKKGKVSYDHRGSVLIIAKDKLELDINALDNSGVFDVSVIDAGTGSLIADPKNYSIVLLSFPPSNISTSLDLLESAHFVDDLDENSKVIIKDIPSGTGYVFYLLNKETKEFSRFLVYNVVKGQKREVVLHKH